MKTHNFTANNFDGGKNRRIYRIWANMLQRCTNEKNPRYADYGARGITVCKRWHSFEKFFADMGYPPAQCTLDRRDNDKGYSKRNCRWVDAFVQASNSRRAKQIVVGERSMCISDWCRDTGITYGLYKARVKRGWTVENALTTPPIWRGLRALMQQQNRVPRKGKALHLQSLGMQ